MQPSETTLFAALIGSNLSFYVDFHIHNLALTMNNVGSVVTLRKE